MGQDDFLKLLSVQFQNQDPMKPTDDTAFIAQMAQFSALEQTKTLTQQMTQLRTTQDLTTANSYIGRQATVTDGKGGTVTGNVSAVDASGSSPRLIINNQSYALSAVLRLEPGATAGSSASTN
jgi:flagellar basal-body rod modification protein FlgD